MNHEHEVTNSSMIARVAWIDNTLTVSFKNNRQYVYVDVPFSTYMEMKQADSVGGYYNSKIKGIFSHPQPNQ